MSMDAVAVLQVSLDRARELLGAAKGKAEGWLAGADGVPFRVRALDDALLVFSEVSLREAEPEAIALLLRDRLGPLLDEHRDERGVMVFPERVRPSVRGYDALVEAVGDLGEWLSPADAVAPSSAAATPEGAAPATGLESLMSQMMGDPSQMQGLWQQAQRMMADPDMQDRLMAAAAQMMGSPQDESEDAPPAMPGLGGLDLGALAAQAQQLLAQDPELVRRLQEQLGGADDEDDDDEAEDDDES